MSENYSGSIRKSAPKTLNYENFFWLFLFGSVIGFVLEGIWCIIRKGAWEHHSATVWGPFCIIYGIGAVIIYAISTVISDKSLPVQFGIYAAAGTAVEYVSSFAQEKILGSTSWDYSRRFLNINGRVCLGMTLMWGLLGVVFVRALYPPLEALLDKMNSSSWRVACIVLSAYMIIDLTVTTAAILRWRERLDASPASGRVESYLDRRYGDEKMERLFPNMVFNRDGKET